MPVDATLGSWLALRQELIHLSDIISSIEQGSGARLVLNDAVRPIRPLTQLELNMEARPSWPQPRRFVNTIHDLMPWAYAAKRA